MSTHQSRVLVFLCLLVVLSASGCDDDDRQDRRADRIGPTPISFAGIREPLVNSTDFFGHGVTLQPTIITPQPLTGAACPARPPFLAPIRIVADGGGESGRFLHQVDVRFFDRMGSRGESLTLAQPQLVELFGSTHIPASGPRTFALALPFGCMSEPVGTLNVDVELGDARGRRMRRSFPLSVR